jgi:predicted esterase
MTKTITLDFIYRFVPATRPGLPVLLLLHGTGGNEHDLIDLGHDLLPGAALLSPRGKVLENGMSRFFRRLREGVFDIEDLKSRSLELADFVESACETYGLTDSPIIAVGYSNGANIASGIMLSQPALLTGSCLFRPMVPYLSDQFPDLSGKSICILAGSRDMTMPSDQPAKLADLFRQCHARTTLHSLEAGHELTSQDIRIAQDWLAQFAVAD